MSDEPRSADTRNKILEVAEGEFARDGYAGAHLQRIAQQVGVQKTAVYYYFPSKAALYTAVLERMLEAFERSIQQATGSEGSPRTRLERLVHALNDVLAEHRNYSQILIRIFVDRAQVDYRVIGPRVERIVGPLLRFYHEGVEAGVFRHLSARHFFQSLLGVTVFHYAARDFSAGVLEVSDIFTASAVAWRREEVTRLLEHGVLADGDDTEGSGQDPA